MSSKAQKVGSPVQKHAEPMRAGFKMAAILFLVCAGVAAAIFVRNRSTNAVPEHQSFAVKDQPSKERQAQTTERPPSAPAAPVESKVDTAPAAVPSSTAVKAAPVDPPAAP